MSQSHAATTPAPDALDAATDQAIAACGHDARKVVNALIVANDFLEAQLDGLRKKVSTGHAGGGSSELANRGVIQMTDVTYYVALPFVFSNASPPGRRRVPQCQRRGHAGRGAVTGKRCGARLRASAPRRYACT